MVDGGMGDKEIETSARALHDIWCRDNKTYMEQCRKAPMIYNCSRDFTRALPWEKLTDYWRNQYRKEARLQARINAGK
jgi:hypothetical protein